MKLVIGLLCLLAACSSGDSKKENDPLRGRWEYIQMEMFDGSPVKLEEPMIQKLHDDQKGLVFTFTGGDDFKVTHIKNGKEEFVAQQPYKLIDSSNTKTLRLINTSKPDDNFAIISVSDSILKINVFYSDKAYMVFGRKN